MYVSSVSPTGIILLPLTVNTTGTWTFPFLSCSSPNMTVHRITSPRRVTAGPVASNRKESMLCNE